MSRETCFRIKDSVYFPILSLDLVRNFLPRPSLEMLTPNLQQYDLVYGLLDGWWAFKDSRTYPLQPADFWVRDLQAAGFEAVSYSRGDTEESNTQQLIIGSTTRSKVPCTSEPMKARLDQSYRIETMPYKIVDDTEILADVFFPENPVTTKTMPIGNLPFHVIIL